MLPAKPLFEGTMLDYKLDFEVAGVKKSQPSQRVHLNLSRKAIIYTGPSPSVSSTVSLRMTKPVSIVQDEPMVEKASGSFKIFSKDPFLESSPSGIVRRVGTVVPYGNYIDKHGGQLWVHTRGRKLKRAHIIAATWHENRQKLQLGDNGVGNKGPYHVWHKDGKYSNCHINNLIIATCEEAKKLCSVHKNLIGPWQ
ncbi:hypothetical protein GPECTOR_2371g1252 [Gonium pectorale]|uniref:Uncharacterized protein n=1 Tax=Gonium pectorale TaxID=33097 RepID=A0A150FT51_GONPE|nr:hypothetical protein GPECTOR_2371g1252 [Gonium pectorale]|eukprot:KXZ40801.1 hypothetical protein GPECTOR_2371g1252 [Gonium pectorale]